MGRIVSIAEASDHEKRIVETLNGMDDGASSRKLTRDGLLELCCQADKLKMSAPPYGRYIMIADRDQLADDAVIEKAPDDVPKCCEVGVCLGNDGVLRPANHGLLLGMVQLKDRPVFIYLQCRVFAEGDSLTGGLHREYRQQHDACPECGGSDNIEETTAGYLYAPDKNRAKCHNCGWAGVVDELVIGR